MITIGLLTNNVISANYGVNALSISNILLIERSCKKIILNINICCLGI